MTGYKVMCVVKTYDDVYHEEYTGIIHTQKEDAEAELKAAKMDPFCYDPYIEDVDIQEVEL